MRSQQDLANMLDELLEVDEGLSSKEIDFLDSLNNEWRGRMTGKQSSWLEKIWNRILGEK